MYATYNTAILLYFHFTLLNYTILLYNILPCCYLKYSCNNTHIYKSSYTDFAYTSAVL